LRTTPIGPRLAGFMETAAFGMVTTRSRPHVFVSDPVTAPSQTQGNLLSNQFAAGKKMSSDPLTSVWRTG